MSFVLNWILQDLVTFTMMKKIFFTNMYIVLKGNGGTNIEWDSNITNKRIERHLGASTINFNLTLRRAPNPLEYKPNFIKVLKISVL